MAWLDDDEEVGSYPATSGITGRGAITLTLMQRVASAWCCWPHTGVSLGVTLRGQPHRIPSLKLQITINLRKSSSLVCAGLQKSGHWNNAKMRIVLQDMDRIRHCHNSSML